MAMLEIKDLAGGYGNVQILNGASLEVDAGAIVRCSAATAPASRPCSRRPPA